VGLKNNVSTRLLETTLNRFPAGTQDYVTHKVLGDYIKDTAISTGVHKVTQYNTNVKNVSKSGETWTVETATLQTDTAGAVELKTSSQVSIILTAFAIILTPDQHFDAVVVASGHYHAARVPDTPGLAEWKRRWPDRVQHSKRYRKPEDAQNKVSEYSTGRCIIRLGTN
jgi:cation diffusion facilitator CzcD-associated flavoprotein CzcO